MKKIRITLLPVILASAAFAQEQKLKIEKLTTNCYIFTTYQLYKGTPYPANGMYVLTRDGAVLLDVPWDTTQTLPLLDTIAARHGVPVRLSISTHYHSDRTAGLDLLRSRGVRTYSSRRTRELCREKSEQEAESVFARDTVFDIGGTKVQTFYPGPGHTEDNIVVWLPEQKVLYGGCFVKSSDTKSLGNLADADTQAWLASVRRTMRKFPSPRFVVPGHEGWQSNKGLQHTLRLLRGYHP